MKNKKYLFILLILIFAGSLLRFYNIKERGIFWADEAFFLNASKTIYAGINFIFDKIFGENTISLNDYLIANGGGYVTGAKMGFLLFETLAFFVFGVHDYSGIIVSAISGLASIFILYLICKKLFDSKVAITAAALFTFSPYHVIYSRSALTVALAIFFILLGIFFYLRAEEVFTKYGRLINGYVFLAGITIGYGYTCHPFLFWAIFMIMLVELCFLIFFVPYNYSIFLKVKRLYLLLISILLPILMWEGITVVARFFISESGKKFGLPTYFEQTITYFITSRGVQFSLQEIDYYVRVLLKNDGLIMFTFFIVGSIPLVLKMKNKIGYIIILFFSYEPLIMYSLYKTLKTPHGIIAALPFIILLSSYGIVFTYSKIYQKNKVFAQAFVLLIVFFTAYSDFLVLKAPIMAKSSYREALEYINKQGNYKHFSSMPAVSIFYAGRAKAYPTERLTMDIAVKLYKNESYRYLILDWTRYLILQANKNELIEEVLKRKLMPVFSAPYSCFDMVYFGDKETERIIKRHYYIDVYDLADFF